MSDPRDPSGKPDRVERRTLRAGGSAVGAMDKLSHVRASGRVSSTHKAPSSALALYLHVPYCRSRCSYCDFNAHVVPERAVDPFGDYARALIQDITAQPEADVDTIFWGGGTPSLLPVEHLRAVVEALKRRFSFTLGAEHTIEANPGTVSLEKFDCYLECGINRLSLGAQSFQPEQLELVGRVHSREEIEQAVSQARVCGFRNISLDLIYGFPGQTLEQWRDNIDRALSLEPQHLSIYQLTVEPSTRLEVQLEKGELVLPEEDIMLAMDALAQRALSEAGMRRYEISNWAKPGFECRHNLHYWRDHPYLGLGCGGVSFLNGWRIERIKPPLYYQKAIEEGRSPVVFAERRGADGALKDHLMMALRTEEGVCSQALCRRYPGLTEEQLHHFFEELPESWWRHESSRFYLTRQGWDFHSEVTMKLMDVMFSFS